MNIKCPNCGAVHSLDSLINDAEASAVLRTVLEMDAELGKAAIRYIGLFRPAKSQLSWARTAKLLNELLPILWPRLRKLGAVYWRTVGRGTKREMYRDFRRPLWCWQMRPTAGRVRKIFWTICRRYRSR